jgi:arylsulfatase A-like enzyme
LAGLFDSPRAGDVVLFAAEGWDFAPGGAGGHGGLGESDTQVPMIFSGSMIDRGALLESARLADVTPTILGLLGKSPAALQRTFDGSDLSPAILRH